MAMTGDPIKERAVATRKVLLVYAAYSTFVQADHVLLSSMGEVSPYHYRPAKGALSTMRELIRQVFFLLSRGKRYDLILTWFADSHAFLPVWYGRLRKINTAIVIGGFDAVSFPELKYGLFCSNRIRQFLGKSALRNAGYLLPVDATLVENINRYADDNGEGIRQGFLTFVSGIRGKIITTPTGYDPDWWNFDPACTRKNSVLTAGSVTNWQRWYLKGCDLLLSAARSMPDTEFHVYGISEPMTAEIRKMEIPRNFFLHGFSDREQLREAFCQHTVYAQFSLSEGLPNALCEALLCGCIPVGSEVNGIPGAIGDDRLTIGKKDVSEAIKVIRLAQELAPTKTDRYRKRIIELFPTEKRRNTFSILFNFKK